MVFGVIAFLGCSEAVPPGNFAVEPDPFASDDPVDTLCAEVEWRDATPNLRFTERPLGNPVPLLSANVCFAGSRALVETDLGSLVLTEGAAAEVHMPQPLRIAPRNLASLFEGGSPEKGNLRMEVILPVADGAILSRSVRREEVRCKTADFAVWFADVSQEQQRQAKLAIDVMALPFLDAEGRLALHRLEAANGLPLRTRLQWHREKAAPVVQAEMIAIEEKRLSKRMFALTPGSPLAKPADLVKTSSVALLPQVKAADPLQIRNRTNWAVFVLADGRPIARVAPKSEFSLSAVVPGYYRLYARSLFGRYAWGPRDTYVPGVITLDLD